MRGLGKRALLTVVLALGAVPSAAAAADLKIDVLSNRADLVSGGDALVDIELPPGAKLADLHVALGDADVTKQFAQRPNGRIQGLVTGIPDKAVRLLARLPNGTGASVTLVGHPNGGPVLSGPQLQPWNCQSSAKDAQCNEPARHEWWYYSTERRTFRPFAPGSRPDDLAGTRTDEGHTVPFIVRVEIGYQDRDQYRIATLYDPNRAWTPWDPQGAWNGKLVITHGESCGTDRQASFAPNVLNAEVLGKGFMVMSTALNHLGHNCNPALIAESEMMARERIVERYGPVRRTIGMGCSGGAIAQIGVAHAYPGFYDGITIGCAFTDLLGTIRQAVNGHLLRNLINGTSLGPGGLYTPLDHGAVGGSPLSSVDDLLFDFAFWSNINGATGCNGMDPSRRWSPGNTSGVRCNVFDHNINVLGKGRSGYAGVPFDNVGVEYGRKALLSGDLTPAKFVDLNARVGGIDPTTLGASAQRTEADPSALTNAYRSGYMALGHTLAQTPVIEYRGPNEATAHVTWPSLALRARLAERTGSTASHALWQGPIPAFGLVEFPLRAVFAMDRWVDAIQTDRSGRSRVEKVRADRPQDVTDHCEPANGSVVEGTDCPSVNRFYESPSNVAGESMRNDILKCQLKPLRREDYGGIAFTDGQWATLQGTFRSGVCDWSKPGVGQTETVPWLSYATKPGGEALGATPASVAFATLHARGARRAVRRLHRARRAGLVLAKPGASASMRRVIVRVTDARGRVLAASKPRTVRRARTQVVLRRRVRRLPRRVTVTVRALDAAGQAVTSSQSVR